MFGKIFEEKTEDKSKVRMACQSHDHHQLQANGRARRMERTKKRKQGREKRKNKHRVEITCRFLTTKSKFSLVDSTKL